MCCGRGASRAGQKNAAGKIIKDYELTFPAAFNREPETFLTKLEAVRAMRRAGGGTVAPRTE